MANLAIDIGNTNAHLAVYSNSKKVRNSIIPTANGIGYNQFIKVLGKYRNAVTSIGISSVNPAVNRKWIEVCRKTLRISPLIISSRTKLPIRIKIRNSRTLGSDRICNAVYGFTKYKCRKNVIIVSLGTAITIDVVLRNGNFIGGIIAAGLSTSAKALNEFTGKLPLLKEDQLRYNKSIIGADTKDAIRAGIVNYSIHAIDGIISEIEKQIGSEFEVILTGGSAIKVKRYLSHRNQSFENAVLEGINIILNSGAE